MNSFVAIFEIMDQIRKWCSKEGISLPSFQKLTEELELTTKLNVYFEEDRIQSMMLAFEQSNASLVLGIEREKWVPSNSVREKAKKAKKAKERS